MDRDDRAALGQALATLLTAVAVAAVALPPLAVVVGVAVRLFLWAAGW